MVSDCSRSRSCSAGLFRSTAAGSHPGLRRSARTPSRICRFLSRLLILDRGLRTPWRSASTQTDPAGIGPPVSRPRAFRGPFRPSGRACCACLGGRGWPELSGRARPAVTLNGVLLGTGTVGLARRALTNCLWWARSSSEEHATLFFNRRPSRRAEGLRALPYGLRRDGPEGASRMAARSQ